MKLGKKVFAGLALTVFVFSMMVGTAMAQTDQLPYEFGSAAGAYTANDLWVKLIGGGTVISTADVSTLVKSVDVTFTGNCTFDPHFIYNSTAGWGDALVLQGQTVNGNLTINVPMDGSVGTSYAELIVNVDNKTDGALTVASMEFKDEAGNVLLTHGTKPAEAAATDDAAAADDAAVADDAAATDAAATDDAAAATDLPKTGAESFAVIYGLGAALLGSGAVVLRRKQK